MAFLPLVRSSPPEDNGVVNPFDVQRQAEDHYRDLVLLARAAHATDRAVADARPVRRWRAGLGRVLVAAGVGVGLPRTQRARALVEARELFCAEGC
jgi:hypothetical protein